MTKAVGIRELRQNASEILRRVETGITLDVTSRGRTVARLVPVRQTRARDRLIAQGRLVPASRDALDLGAPLRPKRGGPTPSDALRRAREDER